MEIVPWLRRDLQLTITETLLLIAEVRRETKRHNVIKVCDILHDLATKLAIPKPKRHYPRKHRHWKVHRKAYMKAYNAKYQQGLRDKKAAAKAAQMSIAGDGDS